MGQAHPPPEVILSLGSNLGDSLALLNRAMTQIQSWSAQPLQCSSFWETSPVDCPPGSPPFLNAVVLLVPRPEATPRSLLLQAQALERAGGRTPKRLLNEPRPLDIDLIAWGDLTWREPDLVLPHPRAHLRGFVLAPLAELRPDLVLPGQKRTVRALLEALGPDQAARRLT